MTKVEVESMGAVRRKVAVEVSEDTVEAGLETAYGDLMRTARVPGFRPGRTPRALLEKMYGDKVRADVLDKLIRETFLEALREHSIEPVGVPEIVTEAAEPGGPLRYSALVEVEPEVIAEGYTGLEVERPLRKVEETDVDQFLENIRQSLAQIRPLSDRTVAKSGDIVTVDYEARFEGKVLQSDKGRMIEVDASADAESIGARLVEAEVGDTRIFEIAYPEDHPDKRMAGRDITFAVTVNALGVKEVPVIDDEFAKDHGDCDTLEELRAQVRERIEEEASNQSNRAARDNLVSELVRRHDLELPRAMVERHTKMLVEDFFQSMGPRRPPASQEAEVRARLSQELEGRAEEQVKALLILDAIARQEKLEVTEDEVEKEIDSIAERTRPEMRERLRALYDDSDRRAALRGRMRRERAIDVVERQATLNVVEPE